jgi:hypothetical protein
MPLGCVAVVRFYACNEHATISGSMPACLQRIMNVIREKYSNSTVNAVERCSDSSWTSVRADKNLGVQEPLIHLVLAETRVGIRVPSCQVCKARFTNGIGWIANKGPCAADVTKAGRVHSSCSSRLETPT